MYDLTVLILAAGEGDRWEQETNKVLLDINGEPLITRTCRMVREIFDVAPVVVAVSDAVSRAIGRSYFLVPDKHRWTVETLMSTRELWRKRVVVLFGDTYYTEKVLNLIKHSDSRICYFGRQLEIYAMTFNDPDAVVGLLSDAITHAEQNQDPDYRPGRLWHTWYLLHDLPMDRHTLPLDMDSSFTYLLENDITMDIDFPEDYEKLLEQLQ